MMETEKKPTRKMRTWIGLPVTIAMIGAWMFLWSGDARAAPATTSSAPAAVSQWGCEEITCPERSGPPMNHEPLPQHRMQAPPISDTERFVYKCGGAAAIAGVGAVYSGGTTVPWALGLTGGTCAWTEMW